MAEKGAKRPSEPLEAKALQLLSRRAGGRELTLAAVDRSVVPSTGKTLSRFQAFPKGDPNGEHFVAVLDERGEEVDLETLSESDRKAVFAPPKWVLDPKDLEPPPSPPGIKIDPLYNDLVLEPDDSLHEVITVTVPKNAGAAKADIYFLADTTNSMSTPLSNVQSGANAMLSALQGFDVAFGVGNYRDFPVPAPNSYAFQHQQSLTQTVADVVNAINDWKAGEGSDGDEGQFYALDQLAQPPGGTVGWRAGAKRIIVWFGDAPGHDPVCKGISGLLYDITEASVTQKLADEKITVIAISVTGGTDPNGLDGDPKQLFYTDDYVGACAIGGTAGQASRIASNTGGVHETGIDPTKVVNTIIDLVKKELGEIKNVKLVPTGDTKPFVVSISPAAGYGPLKGDQEHVLFFDVDFKGVKRCSDEEQVFKGTLDVVADGVVVAQKPVRIVVPPCRLYSYSVKFVCGVQEDCKCEDSPVRPGVYATEINLYNDGDREASIEKTVVPIVFAGAAIGREPGVARRRAHDSIVLPPRSATMDDNRRLGELLFGGPPAAPMPLTLGFLEIVSREPLQVVAVYTVTGLQGGPVSIEVETIEPRLKRARPSHPIPPIPTEPEPHPESPPHE